MYAKSILDLISALILIAGGILAAASLIVAKKPNAKDLIAKIAPYQATIGIILLVSGVWTLIRMLSWFGWLFRMSPLFGTAVMANIAASILLGIMFGMPIVAKMSAEGAAKGEEFAKKLAPYQVLIGLVGIGAGLVDILFWLGILGW
jgi:hypothetical protein